jgi:hypothetical protein
MSNLEEILDQTFIYGVGTNADDIKGNETAYTNLKQHAIEEAKQAILQWVNDEVIGEDEPETYQGVYMAGLIDEEAGDRNKLRAEQRHILKSHGWKQNTKEVK